MASAMCRDSFITMDHFQNLVADNVVAALHEMSSAATNCRECSGPNVVGLSQLLQQASVRKVHERRQLRLRPRNATSVARC
jgi:hypothetical protein